MANTCNGTLRIVAKNEDVFKRLEHIAHNKDDEYFISRCFEFYPTESHLHKDGGYFYMDYIVSGAWNCSRFFTEPEDKNLHWQDEPSKAYLTNLVELAKRLNFGAELFAEEVGFAFCEHCRVDHKGKYFEECGDFHTTYPKDKDGNEDFSADEEFIYGLENYMKFESVEKIYG